VRRIWRRTGVRLLAWQALALIIAFSLAGLLARASIQSLGEQALRADVMGETRSLDDEWRHQGVGHLPHTVAKRARLWHGFEYGLASPAGLPLAGDPRLAGLRREGWTRARSTAGQVLTYTERLPDGGWLSVGRDLATEQRQLKTFTGVLALSGAAGVGICLAAAYLAMRWTWGRLDRLSATAALVAEGRLDVRAPVRPGSAPNEIDELSLAFNLMLDRIGRLIDELRRVTTDVAHDMRRPLNRARQKLERLACTAASTPALAEDVRRLEADVLEIIRTFDSLLQLAEIEGRLRPESLVDLAAVAERVAEALRPDIEASGRALEAQLQDVQVAGDTDLLAQALANLLENALRHTPQGARIEVRVETLDGAPRLLVRDDGPGIPAELRERALAPFGRLEASRSTPGSGLGLAIAASVAVRHGGRLELGDAAPGLEVSIAFPSPLSRAARSEPTSQPLVRAR
jgi:signal transduction histidine kinase